VTPRAACKLSSAKFSPRDIKNMAITPAGMNPFGARDPPDAFMALPYWGPPFYKKGGLIKPPPRLGGSLFFKV
jgi:hypothetical protein